MKILLIFLACVTLTYCAKTKSKKQIHDQEIDGYEFAEYANHDEPALIDSNTRYVEAAPVIAVAATGHRQSHLQPGYSVGGPLANIATGAANQARTQLNRQPAAAGQAAYVAKNTLAQAAAQSAATAAAALAGKQIIVLGLEQQSRDAHLAVASEQRQLQQATRAATAARNSAQQAMHQVQVITTALNAAQATAQHASQAASEAAAQQAAQTTMVGQAKVRAETIDEQLAAARLDFQTTQSAALKAADAAQTAQNNAAAAAAHAADTAAAAAAADHPASLHEAEVEYSLVNALPVEAYEFKSYHL